MLVHAVADYLISKGRTPTGEGMTQLSIQKMLYFAQGWHLAIRSEPLFMDEIQAWRRGPVVREVYNRFRHYTNREIGPEAVITRPNTILSEPTQQFLDQIWGMYARYTAGQLIELTHQQNGPWKKVRGQLPEEAECADTIPEELMIEYFTAMYEQALAPQPAPYTQAVMQEFEALEPVEFVH